MSTANLRLPNFLHKGSKMLRKYTFVSGFFHIFRWYLVLLALAVHIVIAGAIILVLILGPGRSIEYAKYTVRKAITYTKGKAAHLEEAREARIKTMLKEPSPDIYRFCPVPDARSATLGYGRVLRVGPKAEFTRPSLAAKKARDGDVIEIAGGNYPGDTVIWTKNDLLIRGKGGVVQLDAKGTRLPEHKAIWVVRGNNIRIENVEFVNARSRDKNGAGIRAEGNQLHIISCYFHDNESGVMTSNNINAMLRIEHSEFARNGHRSGQAHQIYVGAIDKFVLTGSYIHESHVGSAVKSRARKSSILNNRIVDEGRGRSNYTIDLCNGGEAYILGNILQQGPATENYTLVTYAPEGIRWNRNELFIVHNTMVNDRTGGNFICNHSQIKVLVMNNLLAGEGSPLEGPAVLVGNIVDHGKGFFGGFNESLGGLPGSSKNKFAKDVGVIDRLSYDYRLAPESPTIDKAVLLPPNAAKALEPLMEYHHPLRSEVRLVVGTTPDVGAHEFVPNRWEK